MILNFDELTNIYGGTPVQDGAFTRIKPCYIYSQVTKSTITAAANSSILNTVGGAGGPALFAGLLNVPGRTIQIWFAGYVTTSGTPGNVTFLIQLGSNIIATSSAIALAASQTNVGFNGSVLITCKAANAPGGTGLLDTFGTVSIGALSAILNPPIMNGTVAGTPAPATQVALDLTPAYLLDTRIVLSVATNTLNFTNVIYESAF
jgi:hypothetical protein